MPVLCGLRTGVVTGCKPICRAIRRVCLAVYGEPLSLSYSLALQAVGHRSSFPLFPASSRGCHRQCTRAGWRPSRWLRGRSIPGQRSHSVWHRPHNGIQSRPSTNAYRCSAPQYGLYADAARRVARFGVQAAGCVHASPGKPANINRR